MFLYPWKGYAVVPERDGDEKPETVLPCYFRQSQWSWGMARPEKADCLTTKALLHQETHVHTGCPRNNQNRKNECMVLSRVLSLILPVNDFPKCWGCLFTCVNHQKIIFSFTSRVSICFICPVLCHNVRQKHRKKVIQEERERFFHVESFKWKWGVLVWGVIFACLFQKASIKFTIKWFCETVQSSTSPHTTNNFKLPFSL